MFIFCFKYTATTEIYTYLHTLSLHDALPISWSAMNVFTSRFVPVVAGATSLTVGALVACSASEGGVARAELQQVADAQSITRRPDGLLDRKSTRLNSRH